MTKIAPSILSADFCRLGEEVLAVEAAGADLLHVDVMDGHFVPNLTIGPMVVEALKRVTKLPLDTHLMIENPERYIPAFAEAGSTWISVHAETCPALPNTIKTMKKFGVRPAVVLNPETPLSKVEGVLDSIDMLLVMSVNPGFGAQPFIESSLDKVEAAARIRARNGLLFEIEIDGGVKVDNAGRVAAAGADILVSGSGIFGKGKDYAQLITKMRAAADAARASAAH